MNLHVILAEDDRDIRLVARMALKNAGFRVSAVATCEELLAKVAEDRPDAILLDWVMPEMDGPEACARLRADPATADLPVIFMTARSQGSEIERGALGALGYITKPFDAHTLGAQVRQLLGVAIR